MRPANTSLEFIAHLEMNALILQITAGLDGRLDERFAVKKIGEQALVLIAQPEPERAQPLPVLPCIPRFAEIEERNQHQPMPVAGMIEQRIAKLDVEVIALIAHQL